MNLYLVRHTQVDMTKGICYGHADVGLADTFPQELEVVKSNLEGVNFDKVYCSPLKRCMALANELWNDITIDERIKEFNFGEWERVAWNDIYAQEHGKEWFDDYVNVVCPGGESFAMMLERVRNFIGDLPTDNKNILIVTHAGIIRAFLMILKDYSVNQAFDTPVAYGQVMQMNIKNISEI